MKLEDLKSPTLKEEPKYRFKSMNLVLERCVTWIFPPEYYTKVIQPLSLQISIGRTLSNEYI